MPISTSIEDGKDLAITDEMVDAAVEAWHTTNGLLDDVMRAVLTAAQAEELKISRKLATGWKEKFDAQAEEIKRLTKNLENMTMGRDWFHSETVARAAIIQSQRERIEALTAGLRSAADDLVRMSNARWSEYEGTEEDLVGEYRALLTPPQDQAEGG